MNESPISRRDALRTLAVAAGALAASCTRAAGVAPVPGVAPAAAPAAPDEPASGRMPALFLAHGSPMLLDDAVWVDELARWARAIPRPKSILMISAHWVNRPVTLGATRTVPLVRDFYGFPQKYYDVPYAAPGAPDLAQRIRGLLSDVDDDPERGLDHGAYVPLVAMYPAADVPVLQMSIPSMDPATLLALGERLAPLRREGVLLVGSGFLTHNLREFGDGSSTPAWASDFDAWTADAIARRDAGLLTDYRRRAPGVSIALPTHEHFVPVLVALGASLGTNEAARFPITGFAHGSFTKRSVQFG